MFFFPDPNIIAKFTIGEKTWEWSGSYWNLLKVTAGGVVFYQQDTAPTGAKLGDKWLNTNNMNEFTYVKISDSPEVYQWMDLSGDYPGDSFS
jgi:hypothetical protein